MSAPVCLPGSVHDCLPANLFWVINSSWIFPYEISSYVVDVPLVVAVVEGKVVHVGDKALHAGFEECAGDKALHAGLGVFAGDKATDRMLHVELGVFAEGIDSQETRVGNNLIAAVGGKIDYM